MSEGLFSISDFFLGHGQFHCKASMDLALEGRDEGDPQLTPNASNLILRLSPKEMGEG